MIVHSLAVVSSVAPGTSDQSVLLTLLTTVSRVGSRQNSCTLEGKDRSSVQDNCALLHSRVYLGLCLAKVVVGKYRVEKGREREKVSMAYLHTHTHTHTHTLTWYKIQTDPLVCVLPSRLGKDSGLFLRPSQEAKGPPQSFFRVHYMSHKLRQNNA